MGKFDDILATPKRGKFDDILQEPDPIPSVGVGDSFGTRFLQNLQSPFQNLANAVLPEGVAQSPIIRGLTKAPDIIVGGVARTAKLGGEALSAIPQNIQSGQYGEAVANTAITGISPVLGALQATPIGAGINIGMESVRGVSPELGGAVERGMSPVTSIVQPESKLGQLGTQAVDMALQALILKKLQPQTPKPIQTQKQPSKIMTDIKRQVSDEDIDVRNLVQRKDVKVTDASNPYQKKELMVGRVSTRVEKLNDELIGIEKTVVEKAKELNIESGQLRKDLNKYLQARHAPERNKALGEGAAGIKTKDALALRKQYEQTSPQIKDIADKVIDLNKQGLDILKDGGVIDDALYTKLKDKYKEYVPLNRVVDEAAMLDDFVGGRSLDVKSSGLRRAKGSDLAVDDIVSNTVFNLQKFITRAEKNVVDNATLKFARDNKQLGIFEEVPRTAIGKTFDGKPIMKQVNDPNVLHLFENGKPKMLRIKDDNLAIALRGLNVNDLDVLSRSVASFTRLYSSLATRYNPEFMLPNKIRDLQELVVAASANPKMGAKGAFQSVAKDPRSIIDVKDYYFGDKTSAGAKLYEQMRLDGGTTGGLALSTKKQITLDVDKVRKLVESNPRQALKGIAEYVDNINAIFEDSSRLSVYKTALQDGLSRDQAASLAKNSTINFNRKGRLGTLVNSWYMFANASIQGSAKMLRAMKNPKVAAATATAVGGSVFSANSWNDSVDPDWRDKVTKFDRINNLILVLPTDAGGGINYVSIPVSWGLKPMKATFEAINDASVGKLESIPKAMGEITSSIIDAYNPLGGTSPMQSFIPSIADTPVDIYANRSWYGGMIKPHNYGNTPASRQHFKRFGETTKEQIAINITEDLAGYGIEISPADAVYAFDQYVGGTGRFTGKVLNTISSATKGESLETREIPFLSRFYRSKGADEIRKR